MLKPLSLAVLGLASFGLSAETAGAGTLCTVFADAATGKVLDRQGSCDQRVTPASTFKIAISLMGFDSGILVDEHTPALPFKQGYPDWLPSWRTTTDPASWIRNSVVWYSQQVTQRLGEERFQKYATAFDYGNHDVSGDPGKHNGLTRAWLGSSLKISPLEQTGFLAKLVNRKLPVSDHAFDMTEKVTDIGPVGDGWDLHGKTGASPERDAKGKDIPGHSYGWFVGWATKGERTIVFARLVEDETEQAVSPGLRTREEMIGELPEILAKLEK